MSENIVANGVIYNGVDSISMQNENGENVPFYPDAVRYNAQDLTEEQQEQARKNIGVGENSGIHVGSDAPTDSNVNVWIDTNEEPEEAPGTGSGIDVTAEVGQTIIVEEVDENGKPTKWKAVDFPEGGSSAPADWNAAEGGPGHVLNRTHWTDFTEAVFVAETTITTGDMGLPAPTALIPGVYTIVEGWHYDVMWNGVKYRCTAFTDSGGSIYLGNKQFINSSWENTGEPFVMGYMAEYGGMGILTTEVLTATISIIEYRETYHRIPEHFVPACTLPFYIQINQNNDVYSTDVTVSEAVEALSAGRLIIAKVPTSVSSVFDFLHLSYGYPNGFMLAFLRFDGTVMTLENNGSGGFTVMYGKFDSTE